MKNSFDALVEALAAFQGAVAAESWMVKALGPPPPRVSLAGEHAALRRMRRTFDEMSKAQTLRPTRQEVRDRLRAGVADIMTKALAAQRAGTLTAPQVIRLEAQALHVMASV